MGKKKSKESINKTMDYFERKLDDKNRLTIPTQLRAEFGENVVITPGFKNYIHIYPESVWKGEMEDVENTKNPASPLVSGLIIFFGYIVAGIIPLAPYLLLPKVQAIPVSIGLALTGLFLLGIYKGKISHKSPLRSALEVLIIGGIAAGIGIAVGLIFKV